MNKIFFTVGPSQLYPTVKKHLSDGIKQDILSLSHRGSEFKDMYLHTETLLRKLLNIPKSHHIFFVSSGHEGMERIIMNTVYKYSFHLVDGAFSKKFYEQALGLKKHPDKVEATNGEGFDFSSLKIPQRTEVICITQNETSTGMQIAMEDIYSLKKTNPESLIAIDIVSSAPYTSIDFNKIDLAFFSVQKGFGLPAGLGILIANDKAIKKAQWMAEKDAAIGKYHNFISLHESFIKKQTPSTPNVMNIYLLGKVVEDMLEKGIDTIREETEKKATLLYDFFEKHPTYKPAVQEKHRSKTTLVINTKGETEKIVEALAKKGFIIGKGYGDRKKDQMRIGNFPAHTVGQVKQLLKHFKATA